MSWVPLRLISLWQVHLSCSVAWSHDTTINYQEWNIFHLFFFVAFLSSVWFMPWQNWGDLWLFAPPVDNKLVWLPRWICKVMQALYGISKLFTNSWLKYFFFKTLFTQLLPLPKYIFIEIVFHFFFSFLFFMEWFKNTITNTGLM